MQLRLALQRGSGRGLREAADHGIFGIVESDASTGALGRSRAGGDGGPTELTEVRGARRRHIMSASLPTALAELE